MSRAAPPPATRSVIHPSELITRVPPTKPKGAFDRGLDQVLRRWFNRNLGLWCSHRRYDFHDGRTVCISMMLHIEPFHAPLKGDACYRFRWWPREKVPFFTNHPRYADSGVMEAYLVGHQLHRNRGYLCGSPVRSRIRQVDEHEVVFESHYMEWDILEHIRLVDDARFRSRSIYSWKDGTLELVEVHHEAKVEPDGTDGDAAPLPEPHQPSTL